MRKGKKKKAEKTRGLESKQQKTKPESFCLIRMSPNSHLKANQPNPLGSVPLFLIFTQAHRHPKFYTSPDNLLSCFLQSTASSSPCQDRKQPRAEQRWAGREGMRDLFHVLQLLQVEGTGVGLGVVQDQQSIQAAKHMKLLSAFRNELINPQGWVTDNEHGYPNRNVWNFKKTELAKWQSERPLVTVMMIK